MVARGNNQGKAFNEGVSRVLTFTVFQQLLYRKGEEMGQKNRQEVISTINQAMKRMCARLGCCSLLHF